MSKFDSIFWSFLVIAAVLVAMMVWHSQGRLIP